MPEPLPSVMKNKDANIFIIKHILEKCKQIVLNGLIPFHLLGVLNII